MAYPFHGPITKRQWKFSAPVPAAFPGRMELEQAAKTLVRTFQGLAPGKRQQPPTTTIPRSLDRTFARSPATSSMDDVVEGTVSVVLIAAWVGLLLMTVTMAIAFCSASASHSIHKGTAVGLSARSAMLAKRWSFWRVAPTVQNAVNAGRGMYGNAGVTSAKGAVHAAAGTVAVVLNSVIHVLRRVVWAMVVCVAGPLLHVV